jgi:hypothetical protein
MPAACTRRGHFSSLAIMKSAYDVSGPCSFGRMPRAARPQVGELQRREQPSRRFEKRFERQPIAFVVVFPLLKPRGRTKRDVPVNGLAEMVPRLCVCGSG